MRVEKDTLMMDNASKPIISVKGIGKRYQLGATHGGFEYKTLRDSIAGTFRAPFRLFAQNRNENTNSKNSQYIWALKDVSFDVRQGEVIGIIGRNGSGKSTLLKILSQITEPTEGEINIRGRVASLLEVGTGFHPELTGRENIFMNGAILGMTRAEIKNRFDEIVAFAQVEKFIDTPVKRYSSGMYVRLAFAVAAHLEPEILLVDEVLAVGDIAFQKKCMGKMGEVAKQGRTVLFVSHNMAAIDSLCSKACLLDAGRITASGKTGEVIDIYLSSVKEITSKSLRDRKDRSGNGRLVFTGVRLENGNAAPVDSLVPGKDACIVLEYETKETLKDVSVAISFYGLYGQFLLQCHNEMVGQPFDSLPPNGEIRCSIPKLPFAPGSYNLNLYCAVCGVLADWVQEAWQISVVEGDYYGTGKIPPASHGGFLTSQSWTFNSIES